MTGPETLLAKARRHVAEGEARVDRQAALVRRMIADGHDPAPYLRLLAELQRALDAMRDHLLYEEERTRPGSPDGA